jgi:hypothetical protein
MMRACIACDSRVSGHFDKSTLMGNGNFLCRLALPRSVKHWWLTPPGEKLIKIGSKVVTHSRYAIFQMAEVAVPRELLAVIVERIQRFGFRGHCRGESRTSSILS